MVSFASARHHAVLAAYFARHVTPLPGISSPFHSRDLSLGMMPRLRGGRWRRMPLPLGFDQLAAILFMPCVLASIAAAVVIGRALGWV